MTLRRDIEILRLTIVPERYGRGKRR
jgi:hypothetical protein